MFESFVDWLRDVLEFLGVLSQKRAKLCLLGLDNAGKTTLLHVLKSDRLAAAQPTLHPNCEELVIGSVHFLAYDLGGHETARRIWSDYYAAVDGLVFMVDAADRTRYRESREELAKLLIEPALANVPIAVLGNKIDIPTAASEEELRYALGLHAHVTCGKAVRKGDPWMGRPVELFMTSVVKRMGYAEAFLWLGRLV